MKEQWISKKKFYDQASEYLKEYSSEKLNDLLLNWVENVSPGERQIFLDIINPENSKKNIPNSDPDLLDTIDKFIEDIHSGICGLEEDNMEDLDEEMDDLPGPDLNELLYRIENQLRIENITLAKDAYETILNLASEELNEDEDLYDMMPSRNLINLREAGAHYLRAIYLSTTETERLNQILNAIIMHHTFILNLNPIHAMIEAELEPLPDFDGFLNQWINYLPDNDPNELKILFREALLLKGDLPRIIELAHQPGPHQAYAYFDWTNLLLKKNDYKSFIEVIQEAMEIIPPSDPLYTYMAINLSTYADQAGRPDLSTQGHQLAFKATLSLLHLGLLGLSCKKSGTRKMDLHRTFEFLYQKFEEELNIKQKNEKVMHHLERLMVLTCILGEDEDQAIEIMDTHHRMQNDFLFQQVMAAHLNRLLCLKEKDITQYPAVIIFWEDSYRDICDYVFSIEDNIILPIFDRMISSEHISDEQAKKYQDWVIDRTEYWISVNLKKRKKNTYRNLAILLISTSQMLIIQGNKPQSDALVKKVMDHYHHQPKFISAINDVLNIKLKSTNPGSAPPEEYPDFRLIK